MALLIQDPQSKEAFDSKSRRLKAILELRKLVVDGHSPGEIQEALGVSRRTYYRYLKTAFEPDRRALERQDTNELMRWICILVERNNRIYQILKDVASDPKVSGQDRIEACREMYQVTKGIADIYKQTPIIPINFKKVMERYKQQDNNNVLSSSSQSRFLPPAMYDPTEQEQQEQQEEQTQVVRAGEETEDQDQEQQYQQQQHHRNWRVSPREKYERDYRP